MFIADPIWRRGSPSDGSGRAGDGLESPGSRSDADHPENRSSFLPIKNGPALAHLPREELTVWNASRTFSV
jgi:hypothetical protein